MAVLPWGHSRNQTNTGSDKTKGSALDWIPRGAAEPSRQALSQLMKQHSRGDSGGSTSLQDRSRTGTPASSHRSAASTDSRKGHVAKISTDKSTTSHSRSNTPVRPSTSTIERSDSTSKSLLQKAGLLRRQGSKMGRSFNTSHGSGVVSPTRSTSSRAGFRPKDAPTSPITEISPRPSISKPYDFTHVMHGDINVFSGLGPIDESDLALQFDAIQARYRNVTEFGDSFPREPQALSPTKVVKRSRSLAPSPQLPVGERPSTPPPALPPKNSPTFTSTPTDVRTSRSTENFSRPNPRSPVSSPIVDEPRPSSCHLLKANVVAPVSDTKLESSDAKPLPQLPSLVHAVSTEDDTARPSILAPLPSPPPVFDKEPSEQPRQSFSKGSLRQMATFPSARQLQNRHPFQDSHLLDIKEDVSIRPQSDYEINQHSYRLQSEKHVLQETQNMDAEDWEIAIDSAWDLDDDLDATPDGNQSPHLFTIQLQDPETCLTVEQPLVDDSPSPASPLMTMAPTRRSQHIPRPERSPSLADRCGTSQQPTRNSSALVGLGIETHSGVATNSHVSRPPHLEGSTADTSRTNSRQTRSTYSGISHSSSQESIILSIASSIMSTQRSSISSVSVSDYAHCGKSERASIANSVSSPLLNVNTQKAARPESTCLPPALLQQMNLDVQKNARPDSTCLPSVSPSKRNSGVRKSSRPESVCLPGDVLATFPVPVNASRRCSATKFTSVDRETGADNDSVSDLPSNARIVPGSRTSTASRTSTNFSRDSTPSSRQRSGTQDSRSRQTRGSYSLFPSAAPSASTSSNMNVEGVAS